MLLLVIDLSSLRKMLDHEHEHEQEEDLERARSLYEAILHIAPDCHAVLARRLWSRAYLLIAPWLLSTLSL